MQNNIRKYVFLLTFSSLLTYNGIYEQAFIWKENNMRDKCEVTLVHPEVVQRVERQLESREKIYGLAIFFKAFADETRLRIMNALLY